MRLLPSVPFEVVRTSWRHDMEASSETPVTAIVNGVTRSTGDRVPVELRFSL